MSRRLLAVAPVNHPGRAEITLVRLLGDLQMRGWAIALGTLGPGPLHDLVERLPRSGWADRVLAASQAVADRRPGLHADAPTPVDTWITWNG